MRKMHRMLRKEINRRAQIGFIIAFLVCGFLLNYIIYMPS